MLWNIWQLTLPILVILYILICCEMTRNCLLKCVQLSQSDNGVKYEIYTYINWGFMQCNNQSASGNIIIEVTLFVGGKWAEFIVFPWRLCCVVLHKSAWWGSYVLLFESHYGVYGEESLVALGLYYGSKVWWISQKSIQNWCVCVCVCVCVFAQLKNVCWGRGMEMRYYTTWTLFHRVIATNAFICKAVEHFAYHL